MDLKKVETVRPTWLKLSVYKCSWCKSVPCQYPSAWEVEDGHGKLLTSLQVYSMTHPLLSLFPAIFYYAGHGYEHLGRNYMVPIDAPQPYAPENCISVQRILQKMQQQQTALNLILLDTCRKW